MVLTVSFVLSSATNSFLSPSPSGLPATSPGWTGFASAQLDISNGCQDHTTSPYAATSTNASTHRVRQIQVLAEALKRRSSARRSIAHSQSCPATTISRQRCCVHHIPSRVRDDSRSAPHSGETRRVKPVICPTAEGGIFFARGLDSFWLICPSCCFVAPM